jgi:hypothetical protein
MKIKNCFAERRLVHVTEWKEILKPTHVGLLGKANLNFKAPIFIIALSLSLTIP